MSFDPRHVIRSPPIIAIVVIPIMVKLAGADFALL